MKIRLIRDIFTDKSVTGRLYIDGQESCFCYTLEDVDRYLEEDLTKKVKGASAIPIGEYRVIRTVSPRFKKVLPRLLAVPGFDGILIHSGNSPKDTSGCILVGEGRSKDWVSSSRLAFNRLDGLIKKAIDGGESVWIEITRDEVNAAI